MPLEIRHVEPSQKEAFGAIWIPWLVDAGAVPEPEDLAAMADPAAFYGATGGLALLAWLDGAVVGGVALKGLGGAGFEFCKLVVTDAARGQGAGRALVQACLDVCAERGAPALWLQSLHRLEVAVALYRRMGFVDTAPPKEMAVLGRTEIVMRKATMAEPPAVAPSAP